MIWLAVICLLGLAAGFLLFGRVPLCEPTERVSMPKVSVIVPARNEAQNLPMLLQSISSSSMLPAEVIVVDDASSDGTAAVAAGYGAKVISSRPLPSGWTGKTWACHQGAQDAHGELLFFVDADVSFVEKGFEKIVTAYAAIHRPGVAVSVLPYHTVRDAYEQLSLFFNLLMATGAGAFGAIGHRRLFGQTLLLSQDLYEESGGHAGVARNILENFAMARKIDAAGGCCVTLGGRNALNLRMFPEGFSQLHEGWVKAFADGAAASDRSTLLVSVFWLSTMCAAFLAILLSDSMWRMVFVGLYLAFALQLILFARQIGSYRIVTSLFYPLPLFFYFGVFGESLYRRTFHRRLTWRGRNV